MCVAATKLPARAPNGFTRRDLIRGQIQFICAQVQLVRAYLVEADYLVAHGQAEQQVIPDVLGAVKIVAAQQRRFASPKTCTLFSQSRAFAKPGQLGLAQHRELGLPLSNADGKRRPGGS